MKTRVTIESLTLKKGKPDVRSFDSQILEMGQNRIYVLDKTSRDLDRMRFNLSCGCILKDDSGIYKCIDVEYWTNPHVPLIVATRIA